MLYQPPSERWLIQVKILPNTRETEEAPSENPSGSGSDLTPSTTSPEGLPSTTEFNNTQDQESIATSPPDPSPLGATPSTDPLAQSLITLETHQNFPGSLPDDLITLTSQVDFGIERFLPATTGSNNPPSDNIIGDLEPTERAQASLIRTSAEGGIQPGHFSHVQVESQNALQEDTTQGASGPQSSTTLVIISSLSSTTSFVFSTPTTELDWSGVSRRPSKQSLAAIFGSILGASIFAGCIVILHRLCYRNCRNTRVRKHAMYSAYHSGHESKRLELTPPEISRFSKDS